MSHTPSGHAAIDRGDTGLQCLGGGAQRAVASPSTLTLVMCEWVNGTEVAGWPTFRNASGARRHKPTPTVGNRTRVVDSSTVLASPLLNLSPDSRYLTAMLSSHVY